MKSVVKCITERTNGGRGKRRRETAVNLKTLQIPYTCLERRRNTGLREEINEYNKTDGIIT
jgi:hypothetical protein